MGLLEHRDGRRVTLGEHNVLGRSRRSTLPLADKAVSAEHASIIWRKEAWHLRDLGSRNGTKVDGQAIGAGGEVRLEAGAAIEIGNARETWTLADARPPMTRARNIDTGDVAEPSDSFIAIPHPDSPVVCLFADEEGAWWVEDEEGQRRADDQALLTVNGASWRLEVPKAQASGVPTTLACDVEVRNLDAMQAVFRVSLDEEHVELELVDDLGAVELGSRAHHDLLVALARARLADREREVPEAECGWLYVEDAAREAGIDPEHLTVSVFRARKQIAAAGVLNGANVIERRPRPRQMRIGIERLVIAAA